MVNKIRGKRKSRLHSCRKGARTSQAILELNVEGDLGNLEENALLVGWSQLRGPNVRGEKDLTAVGIVDGGFLHNAAERSQAKRAVGREVRKADPPSGRHCWIESWTSRALKRE